MAKCDLRLELDVIDDEIVIGDSVSGRLIVNVDQDVKVDALTVALEYFTTGRGNATHGAVTETVLLENETLTPGERAFFFELDLESGPLTYHGELINLDWRVAARADVPWAIDPKATAALPPVRPPENVSERLGDESEFAAAEAVVGRLPYVKAGCFLLMGAPMLLTAVGILVALGLKGSLDASEPVRIAPLVVVGVFVVLGALLSGLGLRTLLGRSLLADLEIKCTPPNPFPGERIDVEASFSVRKETVLNAVTATLIGEEVVVRGRGDNAKTHRRQVHQTPFMLTTPQRLVPEAEVTIRGSVRVPDDAPGSFMLRDNRLEWRVHVVFDIDKWPDHNEARYLVVSRGQGRQAIPRAVGLASVMGARRPQDDGA